MDIEHIDDPETGELPVPPEPAADGPDVKNDAVPESETDPDAEAPAGTEP